MLTKEDIYKQNIADLLRVTVILAEVLREKDFTEDDNSRVNYCTKVVKTVSEKQRLINNIKP